MTPQEQFRFSAWLMIAGCVISLAPAVFLSAPLKLPVSLAPWEKPCYGGRGETQAALSLPAGLPTAMPHYAFLCLLDKTTFSSPKLSQQ